MKLAFAYIDKASINPADVPESVKSELAKINKRQDDIIRFIRHYEEEQLNPMIRATHSVAVRFDKIVKSLETLVLSQLEKNQEKYNAVLQKVSDKLNEHANVINSQGKQIGSLQQTQKRDSAKLLKLISLYADLASCGVMDGKLKSGKPVPAGLPYYSPNWFPKGTDRARLSFRPVLSRNRLKIWI